MSSNNYYNAPSGGSNIPPYPQGQQDNNPYHQQQQSHPMENPWQDQQGHAPAGMQQYQGQGLQQAYPDQSQYYQPPPGPPPGHGQQHPGGGDFAPGDIQPPRRTGTFKESDFVPEGERGEQREAMEQFEMGRPQTNEDRDMEDLQREFPSVDGSLIAALYGDSGKSAGATREMLRELAASQ
ncbi:hypothetical protein KC343_g21343 [Hortaea werneckii]|uniref:CUE domain-containing protein n=1 Tax=Hortaea werneckii TaxID=91943 RepID=A0A3M7G028_HORWE|nr:hypothetical protein KC338_g538 [Hortaea werneckii]KAI7359412.1 hypothetical protein KC320_g428 [Hortaea werneckii]KAI7528649.1 hypothetical protein KC317_g20597 [Hortaea werneckii]KAI7578483.1 hypothetical protein KC343_g21343 [Hortaea werneckii]RMY94482.1 hypothetical protein D0864_05535 [Hortaea werneckii]